MDLIIQQVINIPSQICSHYEKSGLCDLILHQLSKKNCFNLKSSAFFINNPDFKCLQGISGFINTEEESAECLFDDIENNLKKIINKEFNKKVKSISTQAVNQKDLNIENPVITNLVKELNCEKKNLLSWSMKHNNQGILLYTPLNQEQLDSEQKIFKKSLYYLGLC